MIAQVTSLLGALKRTRTEVSRGVACSPSCTGPLQRTLFASLYGSL